MRFIDEIHRLARIAEEMLYLAMEDYRVDVVVGKGPGATSIPLSLPPFTVVGATTRAGLLPAPLRDRFGFTGHLEYYGPGELSRILARSAGFAADIVESDEDISCLDKDDYFVVAQTTLKKETFDKTASACS